MNNVVCFDLDDTLCKEVEYLKSAYREVAAHAARQSQSPQLAPQAYEAMLAACRQGDNAFRRLNDVLSVDVPVSEYLKIYREHKPCIRLPHDAAQMLDAMVASGCVVGLITDGRSHQQRHKIEALKLSHWMNDADIIVSEEFGSEKPCADNYRYFMSRYPSGTHFTYVGDNLKKDFVTANALGWTTVCLLDNGENIHRQDFEHTDAAHLPALTVRTLADVCEVLGEAWGRG